MMYQKKRTEREQAWHNLMAFMVAMFMICVAVGYMWMIGSYWPTLHEVGIAFRFFVTIPSWLLFAGAIAIIMTEIK